MTKDADILYVDFTKNKTQKIFSQEETEANIDNVIDLEEYRNKNKPYVEPSTEESKAKLTYFSELIKRGRTTLTIDSRKSGVVLPSNLLNNKSVCIDWSTKFGILDFAYDEGGVRGTLTFAGQPFFTLLPWKSIWIIHIAEEGVNPAGIWAVAEDSN